MPYIGVLDRGASKGEKGFWAAAPSPPPKLFF